MEVVLFVSGYMIMYVKTHLQADSLKILIAFANINQYNTRSPNSNFDSFRK